ncbi:hypothetical protein A2Y99_04150 [Candidatus Gottesmanbacteria bacterium RBG_13_37_7]|uniref:Membrane insertase YidC/Oxa/ALB C-terminal domain-containing protein n=1 Tax=Candidatus Gottesmanbacteria bacterium RBG_13_37_7 TaxID=1798369 RepID=A0A1F5YH16_9BACT|nr:MAG: hypothetical protein A2Y99_04150 [Candidatus Gottesmanbacteria bacterium RBG_13_37_7]
MFDPNNFFNSILVIPILNVLMGIYTLLNYLKIPGALGLSLIILTVAIRLLLTPLTSTQLKSANKLKELKPELDELAKKFKNDKTRLNQEQLKLYQREGINPAAGCLPLLLQMPILIALYNLFFKILAGSDMNTVIAEINKVIYYPFLRISTLDLSFFGLNLAHKPSDWQKAGWFLLLVPIITAILQYWQTKLMTVSQGVSNQTKIKDSVDKSAEKKDNKADMGEAMQKQMGLMMPLMIGFFAYSFPLGLSLYWNTFTVFGIIQQNSLNKSFQKKKQQL